MAVLSAFLITIAGGFAATFTLYLRATQAQAQAELEGDKSRRVSSFLQQMVASADPFSTPGREFTVRAMLDEASARVGDRVCNVAPRWHGR